LTIQTLGTSDSFVAATEHGIHPLSNITSVEQQSVGYAVAFERYAEWKIRNAGVTSIEKGNDRRTFYDSQIGIEPVL
jgi:hypothetical protein